MPFNFLQIIKKFININIPEKYKKWQFSCKPRKIYLAIQITKYTFNSSSMSVKYKNHIYITKKRKWEGISSF